MKRPWLVPAIVLIVSGSVLAAVPAGAADSPVPDSPVPDSPVKVTNDIVYRSVGRAKITLDAYVPTVKTTKRPVIMLVHGGAWRGGDKSNFVGDGMKLATLGYVAFSVNYRLTPQYPYPAAVDDVEAAVRWVRAAAQVKRYTIDPRTSARSGRPPADTWLACSPPSATGRWRKVHASTRQ